MYSLPLLIGTWGDDAYKYWYIVVPVTIQYGHQTCQNYKLLFICFWIHQFVYTPLFQVIFLFYFIKNETLTLVTIFVRYNVISIILLSNKLIRNR